MVGSPEAAVMGVVQAVEFGIFGADDPEVRSPEAGNPIKLDKDMLGGTIEPPSLASVISFELDSTSVEEDCILLDCSASNDCLGVGRTVEKKDMESTSCLLSKNTTNQRINYFRNYQNLISCFAFRLSMCHLPNRILTRTVFIDLCLYVLPRGSVVGGREFDSGRTNTQGLKITE